MGYDEDGRELTPATIAKSQKNSARGIVARCTCNREAVLPFKGLHPDWFVLDIALRLRCSGCSGKQIEEYPDRSGRGK